MANIIVIFAEHHFFLIYLAEFSVDNLCKDTMQDISYSNIIVFWSNPLITSKLSKYCVAGFDWKEIQIFVVHMYCFRKEHIKWIVLSKGYNVFLRR